MTLIPIRERGFSRINKKSAFICVACMAAANRQRHPCSIVQIQESFTYPLQTLPKVINGRLLRD